MLPDGISAPRVSINQGKVCLAFRYHVGSWSTIVSINLRLWLAARELNVVALELLGLHAGALPISVQSFMERVQDAAGRNNFQVAWYRHHGHPVALLHFQADRGDRPGVQLQWLELQPGQFVIGGRAIDAGPGRAMLRPGQLRPNAN
jgi:hypothetical protein